MEKVNFSATDSVSYCILTDGIKVFYFILERVTSRTYVINFNMLLIRLLVRGMCNSLLNSTYVDTAMTGQNMYCAKLRIYLHVSEVNNRIFSFHLIKV